MQQRLLGCNSNLHFALRAPEQEIPALVRSLAQVVSHIDLYHYSQIGWQSVEEEDAVDEAFHAASKELGIGSQTHRFWGHTLYHPRDVLAAVRRPASMSSSTSASPLDDHAETRFNSCPDLFADVPQVMTSFRKVSCKCES